MNTEETAKIADAYVYREASTSEELESLFRLRYRVYGGCRLAKFVHQTEYGFEVDAYDFRARHFGVFEVANGVQKPVGYLRVVEDRDISDQATLKGLAVQYPDLFARIDRQVEHAFPVLGYSADGRALTALYHQMLANGEKAVEPTRMSLDPECRKLSLARFLFECSNAIYFYALGFDYSIACCDSSKKAFYHIYRWDHVPGTLESDFAGLGVSSTVLLGSAAGMPPVPRAKLLRMAEQYKATGRITSVSGRETAITTSLSAGARELATVAA